MDVVKGIQKLDIAWFENIIPICADQQQMEAFENMESQTVERFYKKYLESNGNSKFRIVVLGVWTVDLKKHVKMLTEDQGDTRMHRIIFRGTTHERARPQNIRFGGGSMIASLTKRKITDRWESDWIGKTWL